MRAKMATGFGCILLVFLIAGLLAVRSLHEQRATLDSLGANGLPVIEMVGDASLNMQLYRKAEKDILLNMGQQQALLGYWEKLQQISHALRKNFQDIVKAARNNPLLPGGSGKYEEAAKAFAKYDDVVMATSKSIVASASIMNAAEINALYTTYKDSVHTTEKTLADLEILAMNVVKERQHELEAEARSTERMLLAAIGFSIILGMGIALIVLLSITRPLGRVVALAKAVAEGDLEAKAAGAYSAEMAVLRDSIEEMVATLKRKIGEAEQKSAEAAEEGQRARQAAKEAHQAKAAAEHAKAEGMLQAAQQLEGVVQILSSASAELFTQIGQSSRGADEQSGRVRETATAMEEMNATVLEVARNAQQTADISHQARQQALEGSQIVNDAVKSIETVHAQSISIREDMDVLGKQAEGIGQILGVIADIADQTNLLALNAAIEAARAGDAGRGFAVVADEVRKLAEKTMTATQEVGQAITGIQEGTRKNIHNVEQVAVSIEEAAKLSARSGESLKQILEFVHMVNDQVQTIATASEQQSAASEEINHSVEQVSTISAETAQAMEQASISVADLAQQSQTLQRLIVEMKSNG